jgi:hypothetical protein
VWRLVLEGRRTRSGGEVELVEQEVVGVDDLNAERLEGVGGVAPDIRGDDRLDTTAQRGGHDM